MVDDAQVSPLILQGSNLPKPSAIPDNLYTLMTQCWHAAPQNRPTFSEMGEALKTVKRTVGRESVLVGNDSNDLLDQPEYRPEEQRYNNDQNKDNNTNNQNNNNNNNISSTDPSDFYT